MKKLSALFLLTLCLAACGGEKEFSPDDGDMQRAENVTIFESKDSQKKWILRSDEVDFADMNNAILYNPHLLLSENGQPAAEVTGKKGTFDYSSKTVSIEGNARVRSFTEQTNLSTERFFYDVENDRVWSDLPTVVTHGNTTVTARGGIETDSKLLVIEFKKQQTSLPQDIKELQEAAK